MGTCEGRDCLCELLVTVALLGVYAMLLFLILIVVVVY